MRVYGKIQHRTVVCPGGAGNTPEREFYLYERRTMNILFPDAPVSKCVKCGDTSKQLPRNNDWCRHCLARARRNAPPGKVFCTKCKNYLLEVDFVTDKVHGKVRISPWCKGCETIHRVRRFRATYDATAYRDRNLQKNHGISLTEFEAMSEYQGGVCAICKLPETYVHYGKVLPLAIDHDHETGAIRGLLCSRCNRAIGLLHEDLERIQTMMDYIRRHKGLM